MRDITIVGAGQSGLHLGLGLRNQGHNVRILTNRSAEQIRSGRVLSSQAMLWPAQELERKQGIELWADECPEINGIHLTWLDVDGNPVTAISAQRARPAISVDQRVKMPTWMELFERSGGTLEIRDVGREDLDQLAAESDLLIVAAGKGEISNLFERDAQRTEYTTPQRHLALAYMNGVAPHPTFEGNDFVKGDELGEMFMFPAITTTGPCHIVTLEAIPGGPLDVFDPTMNADEVLATVRTLAEKHFPALGERLAHATPSDPGGVLVGRFPPTRRAPVARLDNGRPILAAADVVALNDPLTGQGANNAARCADIYLDQIAARDDQPFDEAWMQATAGLFVDAIEASTQWTNSTLRPWPEHVRRLLAEAQHASALAELFAEGFGDPAGVWAWWSDSAVADRLVGERSAPAAG